MERDLVEATDNGWVEGDPLDQPENPEEVRMMASAADVVAVANPEVGVVERSDQAHQVRRLVRRRQPAVVRHVRQLVLPRGRGGQARRRFFRQGLRLLPRRRRVVPMRGAWGTSPRVGAVVFFRFPGGPARIHHVGIVTGVNLDGTVDTIEGNTSRARPALSAVVGSGGADARPGLWATYYPEYDAGSGPIPAPPPPPSGDEVETHSPAPASRGHG